LLVQTTGELKGTQIAVEAEPPVAEPSAAAGLLTLPAAASAGTAATGTEAWMSSATPISPNGFVSTEVAGDASVAATAHAGTASTGTKAWMSSATPISLEAHAGTPLSGDASGGKADSVATVPSSASEELPETAVPSNSVSASPKVGVPSESPVSELAASESAIIAANGQAATAAQPEWVTQSIAQTAVAESTPLATTEQPAVAGKAEKIIKSRQEFVVAAGPAGDEVRPELLTSQSLSQQEAETAAGDTPSQDAAYSKQPEAKPEGPEIVHNLKPAVIPNKEIPWAQPEVHTEIQEAKGDVAHQAAELASLLENQGTATKAPHEVALNTVAATETTSSVVSAPELTATAGLTAATGKVVGTSHANVDWSQVEKAQVASQIVERAHLLGKDQNELMVVLKPEFLGKVNLHAAMVDNQLVATIMAESASVKQMLESQLSSLQTALHEQGLPVARVEVVQGSQLSFADLGAGQSSSQQHLESGKSQLLPPLSRYETGEESVEAIPLEAHTYALPTSRSLNIVA
jgi:flagellar hook-length control protein FliK